MNFAVLPQSNGRRSVRNHKAASGGLSILHTKEYILLKKIIRFLRSMTFGMVLLLLVIACSVAGSLIVQEREPMEYVTRYGESNARLIMALQLNDVFSSVYFLILLGALCLNLTLCSIVRLPKTMRAGKALLTRAATAEAPLCSINEKQAEKVLAFFKARNYRSVTQNGRTVFFRHFAGFYGSFLTHLSILLVLAVGAAALLSAEVTDKTVLPGETLTLENGVRLTVSAFQITDEDGRLDFASMLHAETSDGLKTTEKEIRVNEPLSFGGYKIYQQTYGTAGSVRIDNLSNGASEVLSLTESCFLTLDGINGVFFRALYPGFVEAEDGSITLITSTSGNYDDPVYDILSVGDGAMTPVLAFPDETLTIGDVSFTFLEPINYPGLRIKHINEFVLGALYAVFALMVVALYMCFFMPPVAVCLTENQYGLFSPKPQTGLQIELEALLKEDEP